MKSAPLPEAPAGPPASPGDDDGDGNDDAVVAAPLAHSGPGGALGQGPGRRAFLLAGTHAAAMAVAAGCTWLAMRRSAAPGAIGRTSAQPGGAAAATIEDERLPVDPLFSAEELAKDFRKVQFSPFEGSEFHFEMVLPKTWDIRPLTVPAAELKEDAKRPILIAEIAPPDTKDVILEVRYVRAPVWVPLEKVVPSYTNHSKEGYRVLREKFRQLGDRQVVDALFVSLNQAFGEMLTRFTASRQIDCYFMVIGTAPNIQYDKLKRIFALAAQTFKADKK